MILHWVSKIGDMQRGCTETAALVLDQKTFSFWRKSIFKFSQKKLFFVKVVCVNGSGPGLRQDSAGCIGSLVDYDSSPDSSIPIDW